MYNNFVINEKKVRSITSRPKLQYSVIGAAIGIDKKHFEEKNNWYNIDGKMQYFKKRQDARMIGELLSCDVYNIHNVKHASYEVVKMGEDFGLISPNIQKEGFRYESLATLDTIFPAFSNKFYTGSGQITLEKVFELFDYYVPNAEEIKDALIRKYVIDWFTSQLDFNIRNITFEIDSNKNLSLASVIDSESSFGATKNGINLDLPRIWIPAIPVNDPTFRTGPYDEDGYDANIFSLLVDYPIVVTQILKEFVDSNYAKLIEIYSFNNCSKPLILDNALIEYLKRYIEQRQNEANSFLKL